MKLEQIHNSRAAWARLLALKLPVLTALDLMKYYRLVKAEGELIESGRQKIFYEVCNGKQTLRDGDPELSEYLGKFSELLCVPSDLKPFAMTLTKLLEILNKTKGNEMSAEDIERLEPFFLEEPAAVS